MDSGARIPAALQALGPVADRDVCVLDGTDAVLAGVDGVLTGHLLSLGGWVRSLPDASADPWPRSRMVERTSWYRARRDSGRGHRTGKPSSARPAGCYDRMGVCWSSTTTGETR